MKEHLNDTDMRAGWDARAEEDPFYYILTADKYRDPLLFNEAGIRDAAFILSAVEPFLKGRTAVLDIGCGIGRVLKFISCCFLKAYGADVSPEMAKRGWYFLSGCENTHIFVTDGLHLNGVPEEIDLAYAMLLFEHFPNQEVGLSLLRETYRVLAPGGIFFLRIATSEGIKISNGTSFGGVTWTYQEIVKGLEACGFEFIYLDSEPHANPAYTFRSIIGRKA